MSDTFDLDSLINSFDANSVTPLNEVTDSKSTDNTLNEVVPKTEPKKDNIDDALNDILSDSKPIMEPLNESVTQTENTAPVTKTVETPVNESETPNVEEPKAENKPVATMENYEKPVTPEEKADMETDEATNETKKLAREFVSRYINLMLQKKAIMDDVKALKKTYEEQGIPTGIAVKAINDLKAEIKSGTSIVDEVSTYKEWFSSNKEIVDKVVELQAKA